MLRKKIATLILVATITNLASAPLSTLAETLTTDNVSQEEVNESKEAKVTKVNLSNSQYTDKYNEMFKVSNDQITISNNGGQYGSSNINKAIDMR